MENYETSWELAREWTNELFTEDAQDTNDEKYLVSDLSEVTKAFQEDFEAILGETNVVSHEEAQSMLTGAMGDDASAWAESKGIAIL